MIHLTTAVTTVGAALRFTVRAAPVAYRTYKRTKYLRTATSLGAHAKRNVGSFRYQPTYVPEERWWE